MAVCVWRYAPMGERETPQKGASDVQSTKPSRSVEYGGIGDATGRLKVC